MKYFLYVIVLIILVSALTLCYLSSLQYYDGPKSDHYDGKQFFNPYDKYKQSFRSFIKWRLTANPQQCDDAALVEKYDIPPSSFDTGIRVSYVGHATLLIQVDGINILTDPVWSERASPLSFVGPKRLIDTGIKFTDLPKIDLVLISHNHYDHMDKATIKNLVKRDNPLFVVPLGNDKILKSSIPKINVIALDWFDVKEHEGLTINLVPVLHWSSRYGVDRNKALWGGFVIESSSGNIYFSGDTGFGSGKVFDLVREKFGSIKLSLIAIGAYEPRWFMKYSHNNPDDAVNAFMKLNSEFGIPIHHGVFRLTDECAPKQINDFNKALADNQISGDNFKLLKVGQFWIIDP